MNDQARALVADLRALLARHPRARAIDAHDGTRLQIYITAVDDAAVDTYAAELGLGPPAYASHEEISWYRAALSEHDAAITVIGPPPQAGAITRGGEVARWDAGGVAPSRHRCSGIAKPPRSNR